ncbi:MAG TPA: SMP-30/gluconolactonase/LRE family protein [Bauldia sp.]
MADPVCVVPAGDWTGEGALWHAAERALYWVDINRFLIHRYDPSTRAVRTWFFLEPPTAIGLTDRVDTLIVSLASRLILWQPDNDARADFASPHHDWPKVRFNDARPDPAGNFWAGTMQNNVADDGGDIPITDRTLGSLFRVTGRGVSTIEKSGIGIANTFCWSPDATRFYFGDTLANVISVWDYDRATGRIANERPFFSGYDRGGPDGSAVDSAGYLWNARYGGGCVVRVAPDGRIDRIVEMPAAAVTTCTFGGFGLTTLYITTARGGLGMANRERFAGGLFALEVEIPGLPENVFRLHD